MRVSKPIRIILHAGMHKTGTSALQNSAYSRRDVLLSAGVLYPTTGLHFDSPQAGCRHLGLQRSLEQEGPRGFVVNRLRREIADSSCHTVILSHEGFFTPTLDAGLLREALDGFDIYVLLYLRHPVDYIESKYREWVRLLGYTAEIDQFLSWQWPFLDVLDLAGEWERYFGKDRMTIYSYDSLQTSRDILDQLLALIAVPGVTLEPHPNNNPGPTNEYTLAKLVANRLRLAGRPIDPKLAASLNLDYGGNGGRLLSSEAVEEIQTRAEPAFAELLLRYGQQPNMVSKWAARQRDDAFFDSDLRDSVARQIEAAAVDAAQSARRKAKVRSQATVKARRTKRALRNAKAQLEDTKLLVAQLEGQLNEHKEYLARAQKAERTLEETAARLKASDAKVSELEKQLDDARMLLIEAKRTEQTLEATLARQKAAKAKIARLKARLARTKGKLQQVQHERDNLQRRLELLKIWRLSNWADYPTLLRQKLERSMQRLRRRHS